MKRFFFVLCVVVAVTTLGFHAHYPYLDDPGLGKTGLVLVLVSLACAAILLAPFRKGTEPEAVAVHRADLYFCLAALLLALGLYLVGIRSAGPWTEETWWVEQSREILDGVRIHPIGFKGDHPANFQAWPAAFVLLVTRDPLLAVRLPGVLYALATACFCAGTVRLFRPRALLLPSFVLAVFSLTLLYYSHSGWNEMSIVPFLISGQLYFFGRAALRRSSRALLPLVFFAGFGFWTLYTPFAFSLIVLGGLAVLPSSRMPTRQKLLFGLAFLLIVAPTIGKAIEYPEVGLTRHEEFLKGGEWGRHFDERYRRLPTYAANFGTTLRHMLPPRDAIEEWNLAGVNLEATTSALALVGLLAGAVRFSWLQRSVLFGSFFLLLAGLVLSNPQASIWRELCLLPFPLILAGVGWSFLVDGIRGRAGGRWLAPSAGGILIVLHLGIWTHRYIWFELRDPGNPLGEAVLALHSETRRGVGDATGVAVPDTDGRLVWRYFNALEYGYPVPPLVFGSPEELETPLRDRKVGAIVVPLQEASPSREAVSGFLSGHQIRTTQEAVLDRFGRPAGWIFFVP